jgi:hypothetical protein
MNTSKKLKLILATLLIFFSGICHAHYYAIPTVDSKQIEKWLSVNDQYRHASLNDCECDDNIKEMRVMEPNYTPNYAPGNFNGSPGFAVIVLEKQKPFQASRAKIIIFSKNQNVSPIIINYPFIRDQSIARIGLFVEHRKNNFDKLLIGTFNSEAEEVVIPR